MWPRQHSTGPKTHFSWSTHLCFTFLWANVFLNLLQSLQQYSLRKGDHLPQPQATLNSYAIMFWYRSNPGTKTDCSLLASDPTMNHPWVLLTLPLTTPLNPFPQPIPPGSGSHSIHNHPSSGSNSKQCLV